MEILIFTFTALSLIAGGAVGADLQLPETIDVRITGQAECKPNLHYHIETIDFKEYVKGVLPNEWGHEWPEESLRAGAIAVKMYAWSVIAAGGKWSDADVYDCTYDQVYNPALRTAATDQAVEDTWNTALVTKNPGKLIRTYYNAWLGGCYERKEAGQCMGQWNSKADAEGGLAAAEILTKYYDYSMTVHISDNYVIETPTVVEEPAAAAADRIYIVQPGDSLSSIAGLFYGSVAPEAWQQIYKANADILQSPDLINVGQVLVLP